MNKRPEKVAALKYIIRDATVKKKKQNGKITITIQIGGIKNYNDKKFIFYKMTEQFDSEPDKSQVLNKFIEDNKSYDAQIYNEMTLLDKVKTKIIEKYIPFKEKEPDELYENLQYESHHHIQTLFKNTVEHYIDEITNPELTGIFGKDDFYNPNPIKSRPDSAQGFKQPA